MKINHEQFITILTRVWRKPAAAILSYGLSFTSALVFAPLLMWALRSSFRRPLMVEAINTQSLDLLLDTVAATVDGGNPLPTVIGLVLLPLAFLVLWCLRMLIEGIALQSYESDERIPVRAGFRWILPFFGQGLISVGVYVVCVVIPLMIPLLTNFIGGSIVQIINIIMVILMALVAWMWNILAEIARANAIVNNEGNIAVGLWDALQVVRKIPLPVFVLHGASALITIVLTAITLGLNRVIPVQWWLLSLVLLQVIAILRLGVRLTRWAGNVAVVQASAPPLQSSSEIS